MRALPLLMTITSLVATSAFASSSSVEDEWTDGARFFGGIRGGLAVPPGGTGMAPTGGLELGVSAKKGVGFGLHVLGMNNPPRIDPLGIPKTSWGFGAAADVRFYFQTVEPLTLYPTFSVGFLGGTDQNTGTNVVLPLFNPGFGARVKLDNMYVAFEIGAASFFIPFVTMCIGWEPERPKQHVKLAEAPRPSEQPAPVIQQRRPVERKTAQVAPPIPQAPPAPEEQQAPPESEWDSPSGLK